MILERRFWWQRDVYRFFVAEQTPSFRAALMDELELGRWVALHFLTARRFPDPDAPLAWPRQEAFATSHCLYCGGIAHDDFCSNECLERHDAESEGCCFTCERPVSDCICPPPRPVETVRVKASLL